MSIHHPAGQSYLMENVVRCYSKQELAMERVLGSFTPLSWRAGWTLGWLSALALTNRELAECGRDLLVVLVRFCQRDEANRVVACPR